MDVVVKWLGTNNQKAQKNIESGVRAGLKGFMQHAPLAIAEVHLTALKVTPGADLERTIKVVPKQPGHGANKDCVAVSIATGKGTQALMCNMSIPGVPMAILSDLINNGPYNIRHKKACGNTPVAELACAMLVVDEHLEAEVLQPVVEIPEAVSAPIKEVTKVPLLEIGRMTLSVPKMSPYEKLKKNGCAEEDIQRLRATLASIIDTELTAQGITEIPNTLQVSVEHITSAILAHMNLPQNSEGGYRGIIANFYSTRITLFAYKYEDSMDSKALYTDWLFDCLLVRDFVGGTDQLKYLARERLIEVRQREKERQAQEVLPATVQPLEDAVEDNQSDFAILEMAHALMAARALAQNDVDLAMQNEAFQREIVTESRRKLEEAEKALDQATEQKFVAMNHLKALTPSEELAQKIREIYDRIQTIKTGLGI